MTSQGRFTPATVKPTISQADFDQVRCAGRHHRARGGCSESRTLIKLTVNIGNLSRRILIAMRERPDPGSEISRKAGTVLGQYYTKEYGL